MPWLPRAGEPAGEEVGGRLHVPGKTLFRALPWSLSLHTSPQSLEPGKPWNHLVWPKQLLPKIRNRDCSKWLWESCVHTCSQTHGLLVSSQEEGEGVGTPGIRRLSSTGPSVAGLHSTPLCWPNYRACFLLACGCVLRWWVGKGWWNSNRLSESNDSLVPCSHFPQPSLMPWGPSGFRITALSKYS